MPDHPKIDCYHMSFPAEAAESYEQYRAVVRPMFEMQRLDQNEPFQGKASVHILADMVLSSASCSGATYERTQETILASGADDILILMYRDAPFRYEIDGTWHEVAIGEIAFFDLAKPLRIHAERVNNISLIVARRRLEPLVAAIDNIHGWVLRDGTAKNLLAAHLELMLDIGDTIAADESQAVSTATIQLAASCLSVPTSQEIENQSAPAKLLVSVKEAIERQLTQHDFGPESLLLQFGVSRATLYRMFVPFGGVTAYITERRLRYALQRISDNGPDKPRIKQLAHDLGYKHATAFSRAFRRFFGVSPSALISRRSFPEGANGTPWKVPHEAESAKVSINELNSSTLGERDTDT